MSDWPELWQQHTVKPAKTAFATAAAHLVSNEKKKPTPADFDIALDFLRWRYTPLGLTLTPPPQLAEAQHVALEWLTTAPKTQQNAFMTDVVWNLSHPAWHQQLWPAIVAALKRDDLVAELSKRLEAKNPLHAINALLLPYVVFAREPAYQPTSAQADKLQTQAHRWATHAMQVVKQAALSFTVPPLPTSRMETAESSVTTSPTKESSTKRTSSATAVEATKASNKPATATSPAPAKETAGEAKAKLAALYMTLGGGARQVKAVRTGATTKPITRGPDPKLTAEPFADKVLSLGVSDEVIPVLEKLGALPDAMRALFMEGLFNAVDAADARDILAQAQSMLPK